MTDELLKQSVDELASLIPAGSKIAVQKNQTGVPAALIRALIRQNVDRLHIVGVPTTGYATDLLIGCGAVETVETSAVTLDEIGMAPRFIDAVKHGKIKLKDSTCPAIYSGLRAGEKGIPFIPIRGLIGSDILRVREDYKVIDNPFTDNDKIVALPAINPDFALIHVNMVDQHGNVYIGANRDVSLMAHASKQCLVTTETIFEGNLLDDPLLAAATMSSIYVGAIAVAKKGSWPHGLQGVYEADLEHQRVYQRKAQTEEDFRDYVDEFVYAKKPAMV